MQVYFGGFESKEGLLQLVTDYLTPLSLTGKKLNSIVSHYSEVREVASGGKLSSDEG